MKAFLFEYIPLELILASLFVAFIFDRFALLRRSTKEHRKDRGDYWVSVIQTFTWIMTPLLLFSCWLEKIYPPYWEKGYHLYFDIPPLKEPSYLTQVMPHLKVPAYLALAIPFCLWLILMVLGVIAKPGDRILARWLAGGISYHSSRFWPRVRRTR